MRAKFIRTAMQLLLPLLILGWSAATTAAVEISFYSKDLGASFPHAFVALKGSVDATGEKVDTNYGFTATHVSPAVLMGSVEGEIMAVDAAYLANSDRHFSITLTDSEYDAVLATVERWRDMEQPSYNLNRRNCVFFVADVAATLGMVADTPKALMKKPRSYTESLVRANMPWLQAHHARFGDRYEQPAEPVCAGRVDNGSAIAC